MDDSKTSLALLRQRRCDMVIDTLMVVDDSVVQCLHAASLARELLPAAEIFSCTDSPLALKQLRAAAVDIAIIDLEMPGMDGVELITHIVNEDLAKALIIVSAKQPSLIASVGFMAETRGMDVLGSLQKPITIPILSAALMKFVKKSTTQTTTSSDTLEFSSAQLMEGISKGQFFSHYQPKIQLHDMTLSGVEALARWQHPKHGMVAPNNFITRMEKCGLIDSLTLALMDKSLKIKQQWNVLGLNCELSINLSPNSLSNTDFTDWVSDHVRVFGLSPDEITFEITESDIFGDVAKCIQTLARLRLKGFNIAIDDYGTGFAHAEQLSRIPATTLKLDRSMIHRVSAKPQVEKILKSTIQLAKELGMTTVAEGVELTADLEILKTLKVDCIQGYLFAKPMPNDEFITWTQQALPKLQKHYLQK